MSHPPRIPEITFLGTTNGLAKFVFRPLRRFTAIEAASGVILLFATVVALVWANSPWEHSYHELWHTELSFAIGGYHLGGEGHPFTLEALVNDGLMAVFFFVVGLEIKRELVTGQLRDPKAAALPAIAAVGGMVVPALLFVAFNLGTDAQGGWGIPMATDIAFAVGIISLLGSRIPRTLRVFLLTLAIVDDIGAILVIAFFYTEQISMGWLATAGVLVATVVAMRMMRVWYIPLYLLVGCGLWLATFESGLHATIAGVILGLITPAKPLQSEDEARAWAEWLRDKGDEMFSVDVRYAAFHMRESSSVAERIQTTLHPIAGFVIIPIFALANAGVPLGGGVIGDALSSPVTAGVVVGLVAGKTIGVFFFTWIATKLGVGSLPKGISMLHLLGVSALAGVGFTVSLFVTGLAFENQALVDQAKIGILGASIMAGTAGLALLWFACERAGHDHHDDDDVDDDLFETAPVFEADHRLEPRRTEDREPVSAAPSWKQKASEAAGDTVPRRARTPEPQPLAAPRASRH